ncbi:MAG: metal ABC transporter substrate-binding protein [Nocardioidaceae bacterium]|nr:metal ABC transporter substrate-binding protein [Nocardioidaceae bacterium]
MRFRFGLFALTSAVLLTTGCSAFDDDSPGSDGKVRVAAAFYPLAFVAEEVSAGTGAEVDLLTRPGKEPHDLELSVRETGDIVSADLVVYESGFQPAVDDAVKQNAKGATVDAAKVVDLLPVGHHDGEEHGEHGSEHGDEHGEHDHGDLDLHFWQDPLRVADLADEVADQLADLDSGHAEAYRDNAAELRTKLEKLDSSYASGLQDCARETIVASHDAFGYLRKYGLHVESLVGLSPEATPSPAVIGRLQDLIKTEQITTVFSEPLEPSLGDALARDLDLRNGVLDPVEGLTEASADEDYFSLMTANLASLKTANGCR